MEIDLVEHHKLTNLLTNVISRFHQIILILFFSIIQISANSQTVTGQQSAYIDFVLDGEDVWLLMNTGTLIHAK